MKFLDNIPELDLLASALNFTAPGVKVSSRIEAYTIKPLARDRALFKRLDAELQADIELNRPAAAPNGGSALSALTDSAFGPLNRRENRQTLWLLIGTLNLAHPDHDFTGLTADDFVREASSRTVLAQLSAALGHLRQPTTFVGSASPPKVSTSLSSLSSSAGSGIEDITSANGPAHPVLRQVLDPIIGLDDCEVYSYAPDFDSDPYNGESDDEDEPAGDDDSDGCSSGDEGLAWPMEGLPRSASSRHSRRRSYGHPAPSPLIYRAVAKRSRSSLSLGESSGGLLWSCNYFFLNRKRKRLVFISLWARASEGSSHARAHAIAAGPPPVKRARLV